MPRTTKSAWVATRPDDTVLQFSAVQWFDTRDEALQFAEGAEDIGVISAERYDELYEDRVAPYYERDIAFNDGRGAICRGCGELREDCTCIQD